MPDTRRVVWRLSWRPEKNQKECQEGPSHGFSQIKGCSSAHCVSDEEGWSLIPANCQENQKRSPSVLIIKTTLLYLKNGPDNFLFTSLHCWLLLEKFQKNGLVQYLCNSNCSGRGTGERWPSLGSTLRGRVDQLDLTLGLDYSKWTGTVPFRFKL